MPMGASQHACLPAVAPRMGSATSVVTNRAVGTHNHNSAFTAVQFGQGAALADRVGDAIQWLPRFLDQYIYSDPGIRYATEQTVCFTLPRTAIQVNRNLHLNGAKNIMAGWERFLNDFSADILDTFAPGAFAYFGISRYLDRRRGTMTHAMMGQQAMGLYRYLGQDATSLQDFYHRVENHLIENGASGAATAASRPVLNLAEAMSDLTQKEAEWLSRHRLQRWFQSNPVKAAKKTLSQTIASALGHTQLEVTLPYYEESVGQQLAQVKRSTSIALPDLLSDLKAMGRHLESLAIKPNTRQLSANSAFGKRLARLMDTTHEAAKHHMWANGLALVASLAMPFVSRLITKAVVGEDRNPATQALQEHFGTDALRKNRPSALNIPHPHGAHAGFGAGNGKALPSSARKGFVWFPYLSQCWQEKKWSPLAITAGFFGALGFMVNRRFVNQGLSLFKRADIFKVYEFQRGFPWTTVAQMELTYGLLCGFRLLSARDQGDWQEAALRDAFLGWPTLTYGFEEIRALMMRGGNTLLKGLVRRASKLPTGDFAGVAVPKTVNWLSVGLKDTSKWYHLGTPRGRDEITQGLLTNAVPASWSPDAVSKLTHYTQRVQEWITLASAALSVTFLSYLEPKWGIQMTTSLETRRYQEKMQPVIQRLLRHGSVGGV